MTNLYCMRSDKHLPLLKWIICAQWLMISHVGFAQLPHTDNYRIAFYNVENLFDTENDSLINDEEYVFGSMRGWNYDKLTRKYQHIYKAIAALGEWNPPAMVGLAEVENRQVLEALIRQTPLHRFQYAVVHHDSPDERGIDVALLYRPDQFKVICSEALPIVFPFDPENKTRDILYVKGILSQYDTLHVLINHWPSRRAGGTYRIYAAQVARSKVEAILAMSPEANIILTGDFNDGPQDQSLLVLANDSDSSLVNISRNQEATIKYQAAWTVFDQFIVSGNLLKPDHPIFVADRVAHTFEADWLLEKDEKYAGFKPKRTYVGYRYHAGFSDHLPVYIDIRHNQSSDKKTLRIENH